MTCGGSELFALCAVMYTLLSECQHQQVTKIIMLEQVVII